VDLGGHTGMMCNLSTSGVLFQSPRRLAVGDRFRFCWSVTDAAALPERVCCMGTVVRLEQQGAKWRVAASIQSVSFNPIDPGEMEARSGPS
jgi:hypothetical protein